MKPLTIALFAWWGVLLLVGAGAIGYVMGLDHAEGQDLSKEEAFQLGYKMRECDGGVLFLPIANMTTECQDYILTFCREHPETYDPKDCTTEADA